MMAGIEDGGASSDSSTESASASMQEYYKYDQELRVPAKFPRYTWVYLQKYKSLELALETLHEENTWDEDHSYDWTEDKMYYKCITQNCPAQRYILVEYDTTLVSMFRTETNHYHKYAQKSKDLDEDVCTEIKKLMKSRILQPSKIVAALSELEHIVVPTEAEVLDYIAYIKKCKIKRHKITSVDLKKFLAKFARIPNDNHQPYVIEYELSPVGLPLFFRFVLSTKSLLRFAETVKVIHASDYYKFTWQGYPVVVIGTSDKDNKFHPFCLAVTSNEYETKEDYKMFFGSLKQKIRQMFRKVFNPSFLVNDASDSIQKAFHETFTSGKTRICWGYARKAMKERAKIDVTQSDQKELVADLDMLHTITRKGPFNAGINFFKDKYREHRDFIEYLNDEWLMKNRNWYLGAVPGTPPTNAALNQYVIDCQAKNLINEKLDLLHFVATIAKTVQEWSTRYRRDKKFVFSTRPTIDIPLWANSFCWSRHPKQLIMIRRNERQLYFQVPIGDKNTCAVFDSPPTDFEEFKAQYLSNWHVVVPAIKQKWGKGKCSCPKFYKNYICPHVVGLALRFKCVEVPAPAKALAYKGRHDRMRLYMMKNNKLGVPNSKTGSVPTN